MDTITIYASGAASSSPGSATIGVYVVNQLDQPVIEFAEAIGNADLDYTMYFAVVRALRSVADTYGTQTTAMRVELMIENELILGHLRAQAQIKNVSLIGHFIEIYNLRVSHFPELHITKITAAQNMKAIKLARSLLDSE